LVPGLELVLFGKSLPIPNSAKKLDDFGGVLQDFDLGFRKFTEKKFGVLQEWFEILQNL
ncbi:hypothetical protein U1Q18_037445, partial [Sarracenia purpurea var. burkii]